MYIVVAHIDGGIHEENVGRGEFRRIYCRDTRIMMPNGDGCVIVFVRFIEGFNASIGSSNVHKRCHLLCAEWGILDSLKSQHKVYPFFICGILVYQLFFL